MFESWKRERNIRQVLRKLSRQRVLIVFQPGNIWVVERYPEITGEVDAALRTCHVRGWVEPIANAVPSGRLTPDGKLPPGNLFEGTKPIYRLTEGGWQVINRTHTWILVTCIVAVATLIATIIGIFLSFRTHITTG